jgi:hypothetical protein
VGEAEVGFDEGEEGFCEEREEIDTGIAKLVKGSKEESK